MSAQFTPPGPGALPTSLTQYLQIWCADLLAPLSPHQCRSLVEAVVAGYTGGPWPTRLHIQRLVEIATGTLRAEATIGEIVALLSHGIDTTVAQLRDSDDNVRRDAIILLGRCPDTADLMPKVSAALHDGLLTDEEYADICTRALQAPLLPEPIAAPAGQRDP